ncbi:winged helix-turn-helix domain-containing protein [Streptomyces sp. N50]|uniref:ArsR/SmtB family transcription factor n=1 Tax=Streptomyces sp. N50 TaxID=3081765 RepID=UPI00296218C6|nr:winged helix-turn-helix domain-containing protein [Streptomyces sp. N50]WOX15299.1 winged helix-turn-helix domain-containing protein [Streptomyces sp. N50]
MLRIHFTDADLAKTTVAARPDALWEVAMSLHRFQTRAGRWAHADWYRTTRLRLGEQQLDHLVRDVLLPLFPRAAYFPDFLTPRPTESEGLDAGLDVVMSTSSRRVLHELALLDRVVGTPRWAWRLAGTRERAEFVAALRAYHATAVAPVANLMQTRLQADRSARTRDLLDGGVHGMLAGLGPAMSWQPPVLTVQYPVEDRDFHLGGRGLCLIPSHFCWQAPITLADPGLPPVLVYPLLHEPVAPPPTAPLTALLGRTRATVLSVTAAGAGATTSEIARAVGISAPSASRHAAVLRDAGLLVSNRHATHVLHTLSPAGASLLRASRRRHEGRTGQLR